MTDEELDDFICDRCGQNCDDMSYADEYLCPDCHHEAAAAEGDDENDE